MPETAARQGSLRVVGHVERRTLLHLVSIFILHSGVSRALGHDLTAVELAQHTRQGPDRGRPASSSSTADVGVFISKMAGRWRAAEHGI